jgi:poly(hydroxyalkanoate) granule-associated protein
MATKKASRGAGAASESELGRAMADSAQKIWLAGLGAFERAKADGPRMFETLVEQGRGLRERAREAADQALKAVRDGASGAGGRFDKLEQVFEERVSKSLGRLGVLTRGEVGDLARQVSELTDEVRKLTARAPKAVAKKRKAGKRATRGSRARRA